MADYFKDVDPKMLSELKQVYKVDFEMFGYKPDMYFNAAKQQHHSKISS